MWTRGHSLSTLITRESLAWAISASAFLVTLFVIGDKTFPDGTTPYEKAGGVVFMMILWPIVLFTDRRHL